MSYLLEREMEYRVNRYHGEAAVHRAVPRGRALHRLASTLHGLADRLEERARSAGHPSEPSTVALQGRNQ
ncbi:MAG TPA: hypothetical protein VF168_14635 [Trueperaceae bacterium]